MATGMAAGSNQPIDLQSRWNFGDSRSTPLSLDEFLAQKEADGVEFFAGKEPWLKGLDKLNWQTFFRVCTQEMDDLSQKAIKLVIEHCLEVLEDVEGKIPGKATLARLEAALDVQYAEQYENKVFQYRWALRHPVVKDAITKALANRFPAR
jgi:NurA-like 5'-3' nuclease